MKNKNIRLSKNIIPLKYKITLKPDLDNFTFSGFENITIKIEKETKSIEIHSKELDIETASITINKNKIFTSKITYNEERESVTLFFKETIKKGKYDLHIVFKGILNDKMRGFYRSSYEIDSKKHFIATTQFEATDARRAFPCFDEPEQKAIFEVSLVVPENKTAISNTLPLSTREHEAGFNIINFAPTPIMSTYLLAFIVGDFSFVEGVSKNGVKIKVYTTKNKIHQSKFALETAIKTLDFFEEYFDIKYPLNTLDMIAIPDFASGAMENWGAITYRETALLVDEENSSITNKQWVALVIAHEIAHQWFGNLVTMRWWTDLWLNEGFASYIEYLAVDKIYPNWNIWTQFANHDLGVALKLDSLHNTHPIEIKVHHPSEISEIFDEISYSKGASVIRMLAEYLGEENFKNGLRYYLKKHSYKNTITLDLWNALEKVSKKPVLKVMKNWTSKSGYPMINISSKGDKIEISQERFYAHPKYKNNKDKTLWQVPVKYLKNNKEVKNILLDKKSIILEKEKTDLKINLGESGFYRTHYSTELLQNLKEEIQNKTLKDIDRLGIIRDLFALAENGTISLDVVLEFLENYKDEDNYTVWLEIISGLNRNTQIFAKTKNKDLLNKYILNLLSNIKSKISFDKKDHEDHFTTLLRPLILNRLLASGNKEAINFAKKEFIKIKKKEKVNPDIRGFVYNSVALNGTDKEFEQLVKMYKNENLHEEKNRIGNALTYFKDEKILCKVIEFSFSENVKIQDTISILTGIAMNPDGRNIWLKSIKHKWQILLNRYGDGGYALSRLVKGFMLNSEEKYIKQFSTFFKQNKAPGAERAVEQVIERMEINNLIFKRDNKKLEKFLKKYI